MTFEGWQQKFTIPKAEMAIEKSEGKSHQYIDMPAMRKANEVRAKNVAEFIARYQSSKS